MRVLHWCMLGVTILLLVCEVAINRLCRSLITLVDGFHTLFLLLRMVSPPPPPPPSPHPPLSSLDSSAAPPLASSAESTVEPIPDRPAPPPPPPPAPLPHLSYRSSRTQPVRSFISTLVLASLCLSYIIEIINFFLDPHPAERPLLILVVALVSLIHKGLVLWLNWDQLQETRSHLEVNHNVPGDANGAQSAVEDSLQNGALVLSNPGTSSDLPGSHTPQPQPDTPLNSAAPRDRESPDAGPSLSGNMMKNYKDNICIGRLGSLNGFHSSPVLQPPHPEVPPSSSRQSLCFLSSVLITQSLCSPCLALTSSLALLLLLDPQDTHSPAACGLLVYLDPCVSLLAVAILVATAVPEVHKYGLLLLQATPPHICVSDLGRRIASVPGVQAVHDLHVWQVTESFMVASVHVHCHTGFPVQRCADLLSGVTKVLQSVGVTCCTVQPEFASCSCSSADGGGDSGPLVHREDPSLLPPLLSCRLACGEACVGSMCCTLLEEEATRRPLAPPAGETREEPQTLVIENTFL